MQSGATLREEVRLICVSNCRVQSQHLQARRNGETVLLLHSLTFSFAALLAKKGARDSSTLDHDFVVGVTAPTRITLVSACAPRQLIRPPLGAQLDGVAVVRLVALHLLLALLTARSANLVNCFALQLV